MELCEPLRIGESVWIGDCELRVVECDQNTGWYGLERRRELRRFWEHVELFRTRGQALRRLGKLVADYEPCRDCEPLGPRNRCGLQAP